MNLSETIVNEFNDVHVDLHYCRRKEHMVPYLVRPFSLRNHLNFGSPKLKRWSLLVTYVHQFSSKVPLIFFSEFNKIETKFKTYRGRWTPSFQGFERGFPGNFRFPKVRLSSPNVTSFHIFL